MWEQMSSSRSCSAWWHWSPWVWLVRRRFTKRSRARHRAFPAGGGIDVLVRALGNSSPEMGQPALCRRGRPGRLDLHRRRLAARFRRRTDALLATTDPFYSSNRHLFKALPYDPDGGFEPVIQMVKGDNLVFAHPNVPFTDLQEMVAARMGGSILRLTERHAATVGVWSPQQA